MLKILKYNLNEYKNAAAIYYMISVASELIFLILSNVLPGGSFTMTGFNIVTIIFLICLGLASFKEHFHMFLQNGQTRKIIYVSEMMSAVILCAAMSFIDNVINLLVTSISRLFNNAAVSSLYSLIYTDRALSLNPVSLFFEEFLFHFVIYLMVLAICTTIALITYRSNKRVKVLFFAGIPSVFLLILPNIDAILLNNAIYSSLTKFILWGFGVSSNKPLLGVIFSLCIIALFELFIYLLLRKAYKR